MAAERRNIISLSPIQSHDDDDDVDESEEVDILSSDFVNQVRASGDKDIVDDQTKRNAEKQIVKFSKADRRAFLRFLDVLGRGQMTHDDFRRLVSIEKYYFQDILSSYIISIERSRRTRLVWLSVKYFLRFWRNPVCFTCVRRRSREEVIRFEVHVQQNKTVEDLQYSIQESNEDYC